MKAWEVGDGAIKSHCHEAILEARNARGDTIQSVLIRLLSLRSSQLYQQHHACFLAHCL